MATIRNAGIAGEFTHTPLRDPYIEIRLVQIWPSDDNDSDINCTVSAHAVSHPPPYIAVSYTWGDNSERKCIWLNGKRLYLGHNSWIVLWQARLHRLREPLWIDVLSIDQANNVEKSVQVGLMGAIYRGAEYVFISVGSHDNDSGYLIEQIRAHTEYIEERRKLHGEQEDPPLGQYTCIECGQQPFSLEYRCVECSDEVRFCDSCRTSAMMHAETGHRLLEEPVIHLRHPDCERCGQRFALRWYECRRKTDGQLSTLCRACKEVHHGCTDEHFDFVLTDNWGDVNEPAAGYALPQLRASLRLLERFMEMSQESHQRIIDALAAFSFRPYFSRLWVSYH